MKHTLKPCGTREQAAESHCFLCRQFMLDKFSSSSFLLTLFLDACGRERACLGYQMNFEDYKILQG